ncbi:adenylate/guanylate cyclase domain-containing protein [Rhodopila globiformis]|uniref:Guanylate cyclase domain-containing protein n=1 Tax=Rhodopila globiformis TaxID=1071 RepID=A0A2S6NAJ0_RHOGL|nr:adenylate/guanylate cyclase domain-containing protein [Rhodopila globiformis]PPQ31626.1 hypothetical protein CCS01_17115 [Rhodopila globiformis]
MRGKPTAVEAPPERRLATILAAAIDDDPDLMRDDDDAAHRRAGQAMDRLRRAIRLASGSIFPFAGDGLMAEFASAVDALTCALDIQADAARRTADPADPIRFRIAINAGEILVGHRHVGGAAVSLAARLEKLAPPGGIALPASLHDQVRHVIPVPATTLGQPVPHGLPAPPVAIPAEACESWRGEDRPVRRPPAIRPAADSRAALAVVPFRVAGAGNDAMALADSATDDVISRLGGLTTWIAVSRAPAVTIRAPLDLQRLPPITRARYVLHGTVDVERGMARLAVELNEAETGLVLWSDRFSRPLDDSAALRQEAMPRIARAVPPLLAQRELDRSALTEPGLLTAHDLALRAYTMLVQPERATFARAAALLRQAGSRPPPHGSTRFALVCWYLVAICQGWSADPEADLRAAGDAASGLDHTDPAAMALLAFLHAMLHRDHAVACAALDRVIGQAPFCGLAWRLKALTLAQMGHGEDAVAHAEQAEAMPALGPDFAWRDFVMALSCYVAGRYAEAARWARMSAMHHPGLAANLRLLAASLAVLGRLDEAQQAAERVLEIDPAFHIGAWRRRSFLTDECRAVYAQRLRLAGLPA